VSILFRQAPEKRSVRLPADLVAKYAATGSAGVYVDADSAMRHDAVWGCVTRISQDISMMPVDVVRYVNGRRQEVDPVPQIIATPSVYGSALDWRYQVVASWLTAGNVWGLVTQTTSNGMYPTRIELQSPGCVRVQNFGGKVQFYVDQVEHQLWPVGDLWHVPAYTATGSLLGMSPIAYHAASIGIGLTAQKFGADYLADGGHPSALIQPEGDIGPTQATTIKERFMQLTRGNREPIVMPKSTTYTPIQINPEESQFLDTMRYSTEQIIGRIFLEDPADYGASAGGSSLTYANRSDADLARFKRRQFWVTKLQSCLTDMLPRLRLKSETTTVNEVRTIEDETPFADPRFDVPGIPDLLNKPDPALSQGAAK
jgi:phage portal protein BeeE